MKYKIARGRLYHTLFESLRYLLISIFSFRRHEKENVQIAHFEKKFSEFVDREHTIAFPFARTGLFFGLKALNLPTGSEIIMPPITIKGMLDVVLDLNLNPVYVDLEENTFCFDLEDLKRKLNNKTKVIFITYLFGMVPDLAEIIKIAEKFKIILIEDFSQCLGGISKELKVGKIGRLSIYSASSIKTLDCLGGGLVVTNDRFLAEKLISYQGQLAKPKQLDLVNKALKNLVRNLLTSKIVFTIFTFWAIQVFYLINPTSALRQTGTRNMEPLDKLPKKWFRSFTNVQAKIGIEQLDKVNQKNSLRVSVAKKIIEHSVHHKFTKSENKNEHVYWQLATITNDPRKIRNSFAKIGVDIAQTSLSLICESTYSKAKEECPVANKIYYRSIFIPCYPQISDTEIKRIVRYNLL